MKWIDLINDSAWVVEDLLTKEECGQLKLKVEELRILDKQAAGDVRHRNATRVYRRCWIGRNFIRPNKNYIPQEVCFDEDCDNPGLMYCKEQLYGRWNLKNRFEIVNYPGKGHFGPHRDGHQIVDEHHRSLITINAFLTDRPSGSGGATRFVKDDIDLYLNEEGIYSTSECDVLHRVEAEKAGTASVFFHDLMHDGEPLKEGSPPKWLFRTEVMYQRDPDSVPQMTKDERDARNFLQQAELAENNGDIKEATKFYKKAYRLDPSLDR